MRFIGSLAPNPVRRRPSFPRRRSPRIRAPRSAKCRPCRAATRPMCWCVRVCVAPFTLLAQRMRMVATACIRFSHVHALARALDHGNQAIHSRFNVGIVIKSPLTGAAQRCEFQGAERAQGRRGIVEIRQGERRVADAHQKLWQGAGVPEGAAGRDEGRGGPKVRLCVCVLFGFPCLSCECGASILFSRSTMIVFLQIH
jgi:hypothetical protein